MVVLDVGFIAARDAILPTEFEASGACIGIPGIVAGWIDPRSPPSVVDESTAMLEDGGLGLTAKVIVVVAEPVTTMRWLEGTVVVANGGVTVML